MEAPFEFLPHHRAYVERAQDKDERLKRIVLLEAPCVVCGKPMYLHGEFDTAINKFPCPQPHFI